MRKNTSVRASYDLETNIASDNKRKKLILNEIFNDHLSTRDCINLLSNMLSNTLGDVDAYNDVIEFAADYVTSDDVFDAWQQMREDKGMHTYQSWDEYVDEVEGN